MTEAAFAPDPSARLEAAYRAIHAERMRGIPILNPALGVAAVGFVVWEGRWLGVMVTPWCMNLMLVPRDPAAWEPLALGAKRRYSLPAGEFEFIGGDDPAIGEYQMCSLFSPMERFGDMETAVRTAKLALEAVLDPRQAADAAAGRQPRAAPAGAAAPGMSRRDFLRGSFLPGADRR